MEVDARFWRNVSVIALLHIAALICLMRSGAGMAKLGAPAVLWMNMPQPEAAAPEPQLPLMTDNSENADEDLSKGINSGIALPSATPRPTASVIRAPQPTKAKNTPAPKKVIAANPSPRAAVTARKSSTPAFVGETAKAPAANPAPNVTEQTSWYSSMLHDRFHSAWEQPTSVVGTKTKMFVLVQLRIERDGRISDFKLVRPSGNVVVDESVAAVAKKVTRVDPLPNGFGNGPYEVKINFELNADQ